MDTFIGITIPFIGTTIGSMMVFFMKNKLSNRVEKILSGLAAGVMMAASIWSLIIPSIESSENLGNFCWIPATIGFLVGVITLIIFDKVISNFENNKKYKIKDRDNLLLFITVTLHNIPEGMAVGVALASALIGNGVMTMASAISLAIGIAIQNFPEGAIISMPFKSSGISKFKAFFIGTISGIVEPIMTCLALVFTSLISSILPYVLAFAAGAMIYVVINELLPLAIEDKNKLVTIGFTIGFLVMMILDVTLG